MVCRCNTVKCMILCAKLKMQAIDKIRRESESLDPNVIPCSERFSASNASNVPEVNPTLLETNMYKGVDPDETNQLQPASKQSYANQLHGKQISLNELDLLIRENCGNFISLYGSAGSGKTTLSKKLVRLLQKNKKNLVLHLSFMYLDYDDRKCTLQELLLNKQFPNASKSTCNAAFQWIVENQVYCYFVFDGLDQATWSLENAKPVKESYDTPLPVQQLVANLCSKVFLAKSSLIITSRPHALLSLPLKLRPKTTIYVHDLSAEDMKSLFYFYAGDEAYELWKKLETNSPQILDFCHNPMLLQFVVYAGLYGRADRINTMTNIFDAVLQQLSQTEHAQGHDLDFLKKPLGRLAYKGMLHKSLLFHSKDLEEVDLQDVNIQDIVIKVPCSSWLPCRKVFKGAQVLFYFSHQMLQEIFTAYYFCYFMPIDEFQQAAREVILGGHWSMVGRFMCGIMFGNINEADLIAASEGFPLTASQLTSDATTSQLQPAHLENHQRCQSKNDDVVPSKKQKLATSPDKQPSEATTSKVHHNTTSLQQDSNQHAEVYYKVIKEIPNRCWKEFVRMKLKLPEYIIDNIEVDYRNNVCEQKYQMLLSWKQRNGLKMSPQLLLQLCKEFQTLSREGSVDPEVSDKELRCSSGNMSSNSAALFNFHSKAEEELEKRKILLKEIARCFCSAPNVPEALFKSNHNLLEVIVHLQECSPPVRDKLAQFCPRVLNFSHIPMSATRCHALANFVSRINRPDVQLLLSTCDLDSSKLQQLYKGMENMKVKLEEVNLGFNKFGKDGTDIICGIFSRVKGRLSLHQCGLDAESVRVLKEALSKLDHPPKVRGLEEKYQVRRLLKLPQGFKSKYM